MKMNEPVTQVELTLAPETVLVSKTDLKGIITYANPEFVKISGFSAKELLGRNHNIVRHPDMPPEAFKDLWDHIEEGNPWTGVVKNRAKSGDHYWIHAHVTPIMRNGRKVGYLSVRTPATREEISQAEPLYTRIRTGTARLGTRSWLQFLNPLPKMNLGSQLGLLMLVLLIPFLLQLGSYYVTKNENISFSVKEIEGVTYLRPLRQLTQQMAVHRGSVSGYLDGDKTFEAKVRDTATQIDGIFQSPLLNQSATLQRLEIQDRLSQIRQRWQALKDNSLADSDRRGNFQRHTALIKLVSDLIQQVGNSSNLILDPELSTYYLMDALVINLPGLLDNFGIVRGLGTGIIARGELTQDERITLMILARQIEEALQKIDSGITIAFSQDSGSQALLEQAFKSFVQAGNDFFAKVNQGLLEASGQGLDAKTYFAQGTQAIVQGFAFYDKTADQLDQLINRRVARLSHELYQTLGIALISSILALLLGILITRRITRPLHHVMHVFSDLAEDRYYSPIALPERSDEVGILLRELKKMQILLAAEMMATRDRATAAGRIKQALDSVASPVSVSDDNNTLIYFNESARVLFTMLSDGIRQQHPGFQVDNLLGGRLSIYFEEAQTRDLYSQPLAQQRTLHTRLANRTLELIVSPVHDEQNVYQGRVTEWKDLTEQLAAEQAEQARLLRERQVAAANLRLKVALDNVSSNVMVADAEHQIIYMNNTALRTFTDAEADIRQVIPGFSATGIVGANIDQFHKEPARQRRMLMQLQPNHQSGFAIGKRIMRFVANPVVDDQGQRLGTVVEWTDRTAEVAVEQEIDRIVEAARNGDLQQRIDLEGKHGFFRQLGEGINAMIEVMANVFQDIAQVMSRIAEGDLTHSIEQQYSGAFGAVREDINRTMLQLEDIVTKLRESANAIDTAAAEINTGNINLSARTEQQAASLEQTASSMEELTSTVRHNADNAQQANQVSTLARDMAERGGQVVNSAIQAMDAINQSSNKIAEIIGVIDEIAFQTNLLALNASVEAARAGEQGRGFAVVATEVRNLAGRSATAAKEIKELIQDSAHKVKAGSQLVNESGKTLVEIVDAIKKVGQIIAEIAAASVQQSSGIEQVNRAVTSMDEMTQQNAALAEQTSAASSSMSEKASELMQLVSFFKTQSLLMRASGSRSIPSAKPPARISAPGRQNPSNLPAQSGARSQEPRKTVKPVTVTRHESNDEWEEF